MQTNFTTQLAGVQTAVNVSFADTAMKVNESCVGLGKQVEKRIAPLEARVRVTETRIDDVFAEIKALRRKLGVAQSAVAAVPTLCAGANFDRNAGPAIIVPRANAMVSRGAAMASRVVNGLRNVLSMNSNGKVQGDPSATRFFLKFKGATNYASRLVSQTLGVLKPDAPGGTWKMLHVESLGRQKVETFAGPGKPPFQIKGEMACKKAKIAFDAKYPDRRISINREKGILLYQWKELLGTTPQRNEVPSLRWKIRNLEALGFDVEALRAGVTAALAGGEDDAGPCAHRRAQSSIWQQLDLPTGASKDDELRKGFKRFVSREHPDVKGPGADRSHFDQVTTDYKKTMDLGDEAFAMRVAAAMAAEQSGNLRFAGGRGTNKSDDTGFIYRVPRRKPSAEESAQATQVHVVGGVATLVFGSVVMLSSGPTEPPSPEQACDETGCEERPGAATPPGGFDFYESTEAEEERLRRKWEG
ncbi:unnamed protein product [Prorocentrum cordatum]|uniref:J domain-containing protein n=1 Tax=Prorocentrum cordatum TaxID=2364126 RepID=A0ABN9PEJ6_9DINO|nr:unnamed protein product [Polarella glacialis]